MKMRFALVSHIGLLVSASAAAYDPESADLKPTYTEGVGLIVEHRCVHCHRPGEIAPMTFMNYEEVRRWARDSYTPLKALIKTRAMPPWIADTSVGEFSNRELLSQKEIDVLLEWLTTGMPRGSGSYAMETDWVEGWNIGKPDHIFELPVYAVSKDAEGEVRELIVKTDFPEDRWIVASEARPSDRNIVTAIDAGPLGTYQAGNTARRYREGTGRLLKAGEEILVRVHYRKDVGYSPEDRSRLGVRFAQSTTTISEVYDEKLEAKPFTIPAGKAGVQINATFTMPEDGTLVSLMPVMHERGTKVLYTLTLPGGTSRDLLSISSWDPRWKYRYQFKTPVQAPKGSVVEVTAEFDNSEDNLKNPDPWSDVLPGPTGETLQGWVGYTLK